MSLQQALVKGIHASPCKVVLAITGGGAEAIGGLLRYGGGSDTLLEAVVPYSQPAFDAFVKGTPDKYCSPEAARDLAMAAFQRALRLAPDADPKTLVGLGATASLAKDNERTDRKHHAHVARQTWNRTETYSFALNASRLAEEDAVANQILHILADRYGTPDTADTDEDAFDLIAGNVTNRHYLQHRDGIVGRLVFPGSFNPVHDQHKAIAAKAHELTGQPVDFEICVHNVDKPTVNYTDLRQRREGLTACKGQPWMGAVYLTTTATFAQKACVFPDSTFIVGWDTFKRIGASKYANLHDTMKMFAALNTKFLVFHRVTNGKPSHEEGLDAIYPPLLERATIVPHDALPITECSSRAIRRAKS